MQVVIESIDQKLLLNGSSEPVTGLTILLPDGSRIPAQVQPKHAEHLMRVAMNQEAWKPVPQSSNGHVDIQGGPEVYEAGDDTEPEAEQEIEWATLPDDHLSPEMKSALSQLGVRPVMPASELVALLEEVTEKLMEEKKRRVQTPQVQRVQVPRPRTVAKDEMGYPVVAQQQDRDPGEVALTGADEDGVPQL